MDEEKSEHFSLILEKLASPHPDYSLRDLYEEAISKLEGKKLKFDRTFQVRNENTDNRIPAIEEGILKIRDKYCSKKFRTFFRDPCPEDEIEDKAKKVIYSLKQLGRDIKAFKENQSVTSNDLKLDFYSCCLGFEGYLHAKGCKFNLEQTKEVKDPIFKKDKLTPYEFDTKTEKEPLQTLDYQAFHEIYNQQQQFIDRLKQVINFDDIVQNKKDSVSKKFRKNPSNFLKEAFNKLVMAREISDELQYDLRPMVDTSAKEYSPHHWPYRATIASALTLSLFQGWDIEKVKFLKLLAEIKDETLTYHRAIIGLAIAFSLATAEQLKPALRLCKSLSGNDFSIKLMKSLHFYTTKLKYLQIKDNHETDALLYREHNFEYFEPPHTNADYFTNSKPEIFNDQFFVYLTGSISLDQEAKEKVLIRLDKLNPAESKRNELNKIFKNELEQIRLIKKHSLSQAIDLEIQNHWYDFASGLAKIQESVQISPYPNMRNKEAHYLVNMLNEVFKVFNCSFPLYVKAEDLNKGHETSRLYLTQFQKVLMSFNSPVPKETWESLGTSYGNNNQLEDAIEAYNKALKIDSQDKMALLMLGITYTLNDQLDDAIATCKKLIEFDHKFKAAWFCLGSAYSNNNQLEKAIEAYNKVIQLDPSYKKAWYSLGNNYKLNNQLEEAIEAYNKVIQLDPSYKKAWFYLGSTYYYNKQSQNAIEAFKKVIEIDNKLKVAWLGLGINYGKTKQLEKAIEAFKKVIEIDDEDNNAWHGLGWYQFVCKNKEEAKTSFQKIIKTEKNDSVAHMSLGHIYLTEKDETKAMEHYQLGLDYAQDKNTYFQSLKEDYPDLEQYNVEKDYYLQFIQPLSL